MRPVNKGSDLGTFNPWSKAQQPLKSTLGSYCSYCERWVCSAIHVEHKLPRDDYPGRKYRWTNFLLSCSNCNSSKSSGKLALKDYLWPDVDNTLLAFKYDKEGRVVVNAELPVNIKEKALKTWILLGLNRHADLTITGMEAPTVKDDRWIHRRQEWEYALEKKQDLLISDTSPRREMIAREALRRGMFSIWMAVFSDHTKMRQLLIDNFTGTSRDCFDRLANPIRRQGGQI